MSTAPDPVSSDLPCTECGYNLRTLSTDGVCPECGTPIGKTLHAPRGVGITLLLVAVVIGIAPWVAGWLAAALVPALRVSSTLVILFFALSALAAAVMLWVQRRLRRRCGRYGLGRSGWLAPFLYVLILLAGVGMSGYLAYVLRDTTVYAPGFKGEAFDLIRPGMTRAQVEAAIGRPFGAGHPLKVVGVVEHDDLYGRSPRLEMADGDLAAWYSRRQGFRGWRYLVIYDEHGRVKATRCYEYAD